MKNILVLVVILLTACSAPTRTSETADMRSIAIVPVAYEAQKPEEAKKGGPNKGAVVGAGGGALAGGAMAYSSAGLMCTIGGPLCAILVIPAAIVGGLVGGVAGGVIDVATDPTKRNADARTAVASAVAQVKPADAIAEQAYRRAREESSAVSLAAPQSDLKALAAQGVTAALEVAVTQFEVLPKESEMAIEVRARSRLIRTSDGALLQEEESATKTAYRKYEDWAADDARPLKRALDHAFGDLGDEIIARQLKSRLRADSAARPGG